MIGFWLCFSLDERLAQDFEASAKIGSAGITSDSHLKTDLFKGAEHLTFD